MLWGLLRMVYAQMTSPKKKGTLDDLCKMISV